jgi:hypothetical protein
MSAFFLFSQGNRVNVKEEFPEASFGEVVSHFGDILSQRKLFMAFSALFIVFLEFIDWISCHGVDVASHE